MKGIICFIIGCLTMPCLFAQKTELPRLTTQRDTGAIWKDITAVRTLSNTFPDSAANLSSALLKEALQQNYQRGIIALHTILGGIRSDQGAYDLALRHFQKGLAYCDTIHYGSSFAVLYNNIGVICQYQSRYKEAAKNFQLSITYAERYPPSYMSIENIYNNYGTVFSRLNLHRDAIRQFRKALYPKNPNDSLNIRIGAITNLASAYQHLDMDSIASSYYDTAISIARKNGRQRHLHLALSGLGEIKLKQNLSQEALLYLLEAKAIGDTSLINPNYQNTVIANLGIIYLSMGKRDEAEKYLLQANRSATMLPMERKSILGQLSQLYEEKGDFQKAHYYLREYHKIADSLQGKEVILQVSELEKKYRTAEKDKEIISNKLLIAEQKNRLSHKNFWILGISLSGVFIITLIVVAFILRNRKIKNKRALEKLQSLISGEENERSRLAKDLHDGVNSRLNAIKIHLLTLQKNEQSEFVNKNLLTEIGTMIEEASREIKTVSQNLAPNEIVKNGLTKSVRYFCERAFAQTDITTDIQLYYGIDDINSELALSIYRIIQELVQNILKHAQASSMILMIYRDNKKIVLLVEDDGIGILVKDLRHFNPDGLGWQNIKDRVKAHNGIMNIENKKEDKGLVTSIEFPLI